MTEQVGILSEDIRTEHWTGDSDFKKDSSKKDLKTDEFIEIDEQGQKVQGHDLASSVHARPLNDLHRVSTAFIR